jgi:hypothetical protein
VQRGGDADLREAGAAIERLAGVPTDPGFVLHDITLLRLHALLGGLMAMPRVIHTSGIATATWRKRLASKGISRGPRRCHDDVGIGLQVMDQRTGLAAIGIEACLPRSAASATPTR